MFNWSGIMHTDENICNSNYQTAITKQNEVHYPITQDREKEVR